MSTKNFTQFDLETTPLTGDYLVGYKADGSTEIRTTVEGIFSNKQPAWNSVYSYVNTTSATNNPGYNATTFCKLSSTTAFSKLSSQAYTYSASTSSISTTLNANNSASGVFSNIVGGRNNCANAAYSFIAGGCNNFSNSFQNTFVLGSNITATQDNATFVNAIVSPVYRGTTGSSYSGVYNDTCITSSGGTGGNINITGGSAAGTSGGGNGGCINLAGSSAGGSGGFTAPAANGGSILMYGGSSDATDSGATPGGGGTIIMSGGNSTGGGTNCGGPGGFICMPGGSGSVSGMSGGSAGGIISRGGNGCGAGYEYGGCVAGCGGVLDMSACYQNSGGSINTSNGGGSIDTRGTGSIQLGTASAYTMTTLQGTAADTNKSICLPNADGTLALRNSNPSIISDVFYGTGSAYCDGTLPYGGGGLYLNAGPGDGYINNGNCGGNGGIISLIGGAGGYSSYGGNAGSISINGGTGSYNQNGDGGGSISLNGGCNLGSMGGCNGVTNGGCIVSNGGTSTYGWYCALGGTLDMSGGCNISGGSINTSNGGGSILTKPMTYNQAQSYNVAGTKLFITNSNTSIFYCIITGGGSNFVPAFYDGTNWRVG